MARHGRSKLRPITPTSDFLTAMPIEIAPETRPQSSFSKLLEILGIFNPNLLR